VRQFPGKHFFIYQHDKEIMTLICRLITANPIREVQSLV
jgi:surfactin synthase thioesterase subunit